ncbi:ABC transporter permease [Sphingomonas quercus]|uniref:ABC transporter permease n=1 Tax=Sphingomonas quercus TaxID=2842451 RepID=A0ABS6BFU0_9SPHN|nr:ABC transporter permease [Sphingomonas quercus]MBU3077153.1 ABC transporter permease [Sphingomonas quercus]
MTTERTASGSSLIRALEVQCNVIGALMMRELHTRYGRENVGYLWMILEPMTLATAVGLIHLAQPAHTVSDINAVAMFSLGYCVFIMFRGMFNRAEGTIEANLPLLYHRMVTVFDLLLSRALLEAAGTTCTLIVMLFFGIMLGLTHLPYRPEYLMGSLLFMAWFSFSLSMLVCAGTHDNRLLARFVHPISYILMPISGGFYQVGWIPEPYRTWLSWFPMANIFEMARYGQFRAAPDTYFSIPYLIGSCMLLSVLGLLAIKLVRRHIHLN